MVGFTGSEYTNIDPMKKQIHWALLWFSNPMFFFLSL